MINFVSVEILKKINLVETVAGLGRHTGKIDLGNLDFNQKELQILTRLSPRKQVEWVSSRELLHQIADISPRPLCLYDAYGKPYLEGIDKHISISHSDRWCAAMSSPSPCGVDVQVYTDTVRRIANRFLTKEDLKMIGLMKGAENKDDKLSFLHLFWGAKECLYKAYGKRKLGFREHLFITNIDLEKGTATGEIIFEDIHLFYDITFQLLPEVAWVYCTGRTVSC